MPPSRKLKGRNMPNLGIPDTALQGDGIGLDAMAHRTGLIGGSLEVPLPVTTDARENSDRARNG
jgi:hypothetical protein